MASYQQVSNWDELAHGGFYPIPDCFKVAWANASFVKITESSEDWYTEGLGQFINSWERTSDEEAWLNATAEASKSAEFYCGNNIEPQFVSFIKKSKYVIKQNDGFRYSDYWVKARFQCGR